ncbi:hypothetical protein [Puniceibacterium sp. IMCC21224]|uniref:hypothetical protein n=1 Tax=Puniceibacterium sp. IMCC21224 TaxID=1618204 RepID=UPI00064DA2B7|nr:hypothetical protein [Puniceibacterium sp. IMCC21224]KMK67218.1 hypothetical protein IMCC21224_112083 [Puniceibacterium sp. IMCC21224]
MIWAIWWVWLAGALALAILELLAPGFIFLGFAIGAAAVALLLLIPFTTSPAVLLAVFALLSLAAWALLRRLFRAPKGQVRFVRHDIND